MGKVINDPVHGFISVDDGTILQIIDSLAYQRLRRIRQMGVADLVYPGAEHTRFLHSLGAYHLMKKSLQILKNKGVVYTEEEYLSAQIAILLHDIGHFPYSHALENSTLIDVHHEKMSLAIMEQLNQQMDNQLSVAIDIYLDRYPKRWIHQLISSHIDVDRLDYLVRDSFFSGVAEGMVGLERILQMIDVVDDELVIEEKGIYSVDKFLIARRIMYSQVYVHKTVQGAEKMLLNILRRAKEIYPEGGLNYVSPDMEFFFARNLNEKDIHDPEVISRFVALTDAVIDMHVQQWAQSRDTILADLCTRMIHRRLYKSMDVTDPSTVADMQHRTMERVPFISSEELSYYCFEVTTDTSYYDSRNRSIPILMKDGRVVKLEDLDYSFTSKLSATHHSRRLLYYV